MSESPNRKDIEYFAKLWDSRNASVPRLHTKQRWDARADDWRKSFGEEEAAQARMRAIAAYLRERGLLAANEDVIDIGCGPGFYVAEFATTARHVTGTDISSRMLEHGADVAAKRGLLNVSFVSCDFAQADIEALGWAQAFDLVFASITPAFRGMAALDKMHAMSRKWCFNNGWAYRHNHLQHRLAVELFPGRARQTDAGMSDGTYYLGNILWLTGRYPSVQYYPQSTQVMTKPTMDLAEHFSQRVLDDRATPKDVERAYAWMCENAVDGYLLERIDTAFAWLLWQAKPRDMREWALEQAEGAGKKA